MNRLLGVEFWNTRFSSGSRAGLVGLGGQFGERGASMPGAEDQSAHAPVATFAKKERRGNFRKKEKKAEDEDDGQVAPAQRIPVPYHHISVDCSHRSASSETAVRSICIARIGSPSLLRGRPSSLCKLRTRSPPTEHLPNRTRAFLS